MHHRDYSATELGPVRPSIANPEERFRSCTEKFIICEERLRIVEERLRNAGETVRTDEEMLRLAEGTLRIDEDRLKDIGEILSLMGTDEEISEGMLSFVESAFGGFLEVALSSAEEFTDSEFFVCRATSQRF
jgi:hypothetical protein